MKTIQIFMPQGRSWWKRMEPVTVELHSIDWLEFDWDPNPDYTPFDIDD